MRVVRIILFGAICGLAILCSELIPGCSSQNSYGAPAPFYIHEKDKLPDSLNGEWILKWSFSTYNLKLLNGNWDCSCSYMKWTGSYTLRGRVLSIYESHNGGKYNYYEVKLDKQLQGITQNLIKVELHRVR